MLSDRGQIYGTGIVGRNRVTGMGEYLDRELGRGGIAPKVGGRARVQI